MSNLIDDVVDRGLMSRTLLVVLSEFGRTPDISASFGRNHWPKAWSAVKRGCGIGGGVVYGRTSVDGKKNVDGRVRPADLFATYFRAVDIDSHAEYSVGSRPIPLVDDGGKPLESVLSWQILSLTCAVTS